MYGIGMSCMYLYMYIYIFTYKFCMFWKTWLGVGLGVVWEANATHDTIRLIQSPETAEA